MTQLRSLPARPVMRDLYRAYPATCKPLGEFTEAAMRGPSPFTQGQRELIAAYVSGLNACAYCHGTHVAVAAACGVAPGLSCLYQIATCHRGCHGGGHLLERLCGRAYNTGAAAYHLLMRGLYDESLSLVRNLGELSNLMLLSVVDPAAMTEWSISDKETRRKKFSPVHIRLMLEKANRPFYQQKWYGDLSETYVHASPDTAPNNHSGHSMVGGIFQKEGAEKTLEELSVMLFNIATMGCRFRGYENLVDELLAYADKKVAQVKP